MDTPLLMATAFAAISWTVVKNRGAVLTLACLWVNRRLSDCPEPQQVVLELIVGTLDREIRGTVPGDPARFGWLIRTLLPLVLAASWAPLVPGVEPPTARLGTDAGPAFIVFAAGIGWVIRAQGGRLVASFARPSWVMNPLNLVEQITRDCSLTVRLFGNVTSGVFGVGIVLLLARLLLPIPLMALVLLTGAGQAISLPPLRWC